MHHISFTLHKEKLQFTAPDKWEEVTAKDLLTISLVTGIQDKSREFHSILTCKMFDIPKDVFKKLRPADRVMLKPTMYWIYGKNTLQKWLMPAISIGKTKLYGPKSRLADLTAEEFMYAEAAYEGWMKTSRTEFLDTLFAILYRRKWFFNTYRSSFDARKLAKGEARAARLKNYVKKAVALNYAGCRNLIIERHPNVWRAATDSDSQAQGSQQTTNWAGIILDLAGDKFGTYELTIKTNIWLVLADLDKKAKASRELEGPK